MLGAGPSTLQEQLPQLHPQHYILNQPRDLPSEYLFVLSKDIIIQHSRQDPRLVHNQSCSCCVRSSMPTQTTIQPTVRKPDVSETCISPPAQDRPISPPPAVVEDSDSQTHCSVIPKSRPTDPRLSVDRKSGKRKGNNANTETEQCTAHPSEEQRHRLTKQNTFNLSQLSHPTAPSPLQFQQPTNINMRQHFQHPPGLRLGNPHTEQQSSAFVNSVRDFNPNLSFQYLLHNISVMLLQFMQHPYETVIFNNFLSNLLGLPNHG
jgi:hypothetical protein